jgi:hypothetical protein
MHITEIIIQQLETYLRNKNQILDQKVIDAIKCAYEHGRRELREESANNSKILKNCQCLKQSEEAMKGVPL